MLLLSWLFTLAWLGSLGTLAFMLSRGERRRARWPAIAFVVTSVLAIVIFRSDLGMQKVVTSLFMPTGVLWLVLGGLAVHFWARGEKRAAISFTTLCSFVSVIGNLAIASVLLGYLEEQTPEYPLDSAERFDAVFVLGGGALQRPGKNAEVSEHGDRIVIAARLYHRHKTPLLVSSGSTIESISDAEDLSQAAEDIWSDLGIPAGAVVRIPGPKNTSEEIAAYKKLIDERGFRHVGIVSSASHLPRVQRLARRMGVHATLIPADHRSGGTGPFHPILLVPQSGAWNRTQFALREMVGMLVGR